MSLERACCKYCLDLYGFKIPSKFLFSPKFGFELLRIVRPEPLDTLCKSIDFSVSAGVNPTMYIVHCTASHSSQNLMIRCYLTLSTLSGSPISALNNHTESKFNLK